jgi:hypothetical protein
MNYRDLIYKNIFDECVLIADYCNHMGIDIPGDAKVSDLSSYSTFVGPLIVSILETASRHRRRECERINPTEFCFD